MSVFDKTICDLGEGPLWHPERKTLFWFDINGKVMFSRSDAGAQEWQMGEHCSAAGWVDHDTLLIASETGLWRFDLPSGARELVHALEADIPLTRSNDGRADPWGGFWIGTMGKAAEENAGAIYRYFDGELRKLVPEVTISNAICFAPDRTCAYYTDTTTQQIMRLPLEAQTGWPDGSASIFVDLTGTEFSPDGAVTDAQGNLWIALWGGARVACFAPDGTHLRDIALPALQVTCPAFGGPALRDLYVTSALTGLVAENAANHPENGMTFRIPDMAQGVAEPRVIL